MKNCTLFSLACFICILDHHLLKISIKFSWFHTLHLLEKLLHQQIATFFYQYLMINKGMQFFSYYISYCLNHSIYLIIETLIWQIRRYNHMRMSGPSLQCSFINFSGQLYTLRSGCVILYCIELLGTIGSRCQEADQIISFISQINPTPSLLIHNGLKSLIGHVCIGINCASITKHYSWLVCHLGQLRKIIFRKYLESNKVSLVQQKLIVCQLGNQTSGSSQNDHCVDLRDTQYPEPFFGEGFSNPLERRALAPAWTTSNHNLIHRMLRVASKPILFVGAPQIDLICVFPDGFYFVIECLYYFIPKASFFQGIINNISNKSKSRQACYYRGFMLQQ